MRDFQIPGRSRVFATTAMAATSHPLATFTALDILKAGGNAVDAAIAAALVQGIAEPQMTGLGGDMFALIKPPGDERVIGLNGSGRAPAALTAEGVRAAGHAAMPLEGALPVTVPGAVEGFCRLHADYGLLGLTEVLSPAIRAAEEGVPVAPRVAFDWAASATRLAGRARDAFLDNGRAPLPGAVFRAPGQAEVLRRISEEGSAAFYEGEVAEDMIASLAALGGGHTALDFASRDVEYTEPVSGTYGGVELVEHPPNGQGATAILMANMARTFDLAALDPWEADRAHIEAEITKLGYDARNRFIADPDYTTALDHLLNPSTAERLAALIDPHRALPDPAPLTEAVHRDTIYLTVVDKDRRAVSLIYSIFSAFGAGIASDRFGILFHNRGAGFTLAPGHPNEAGPGKRPMHTIIPAMLRQDGHVLMPFGVMGGAYQAAGHLRFLTNVVDYGLDPQTAIDAPRAFADANGLAVERGYDEAVRNALSARGHAVFVPETPIGGAQAIRIDPESGLLEGGSDPRKDGCAMGY